MWDPTLLIVPVPAYCAHAPREMTMRMSDRKIRFIVIVLDSNDKYTNILYDPDALRPDLEAFPRPRSRFYTPGPGIVLLSRP